MSQVTHQQPNPCSTLSTNSKWKAQTTQKPWNKLMIFIENKGKISKLFVFFMCLYSKIMTRLLLCVHNVWP